MAAIAKLREVTIVEYALMAGAIALAVKIGTNAMVVLAG